MILTQLKPFTRHASDVSSIVEHWKHIGILGAFYTRIYPDGTIINLANDARWAEFYFNQLDAGAYENKDVIDQCFADTGASLWALKPQNPIWQDARHFGYGNCITISHDTKEFREFIGFYAASDNSAINHFYVNHIDKIRNIRAQFLSQATDLIKKAEEERLLLAQPVYPAIMTNSSLSIKPSFLMHKNVNLSLNIPPQRRQCLEHLAQGKTSKEIAQAMSLSSKTIDHYLAILRKELSCRSSRELITCYNNQLV